MVPAMLRQALRGPSKGNLGARKRAQHTAQRSQQAHTGRPRTARAPLHGSRHQQPAGTATRPRRVGVLERIDQATRQQDGAAGAGLGADAAGAAGPQVEPLASVVPLPILSHVL